MKNLNNLFYFAFLTLLAFNFTSCLEDNGDKEIFYYSDQELEVLQEKLALPSTPHEYSFALPSYFSGGSVQVNDAEATLGRVLFYDKQLSDTREVSCASCHKAELGFSDDVAFSEGINDHVTERNSLALGAFISFNAYYQNSVTRLFWDERAANLADQIPQTLGNELEMGMDFNKLVPRLEAEEHYAILFNKAFGSPDINSQRITDALSSFVNSIHSSRTKFDKAHNTEGANIGSNHSFREFSDQENRGKSLFVSNCGSCHSATLARSLNSSTSGGSFIGFGGTFVVNANNGLDMEYADQGIGANSNNPYENGLFKVPSLRNVALTAPYMHDGRFETMEEVIDFYSSGIQNHPNLSEQLKDGNQAKKMNFTQTEKDALIAFLHTLTDAETVNHERFADPFK